MVKSVGIIVQAHMGSTRLKNKMLKNLCGKSVIGHVIDRLKKVTCANKLVVATSILTADDVLFDECRKHGVAVYRGSDDDVLARFYHTATQYNFSNIARVCADNTLIDWNIIDAQIKVYSENNYDVVTSGETIPLGLGCEIFSMDLLIEAFNFADKHYQREHVTPYIYENACNIYKYNIDNNYGKYRFTLDTEEDWLLISKIYDALYFDDNYFSVDDVIDVMKKNPSWFNINEHVHQKGLLE